MTDEVNAETEAVKRRAHDAVRRAQRSPWYWVSVCAAVLALAVPVFATLAVLDHVSLEQTNRHRAVQIDRLQRQVNQLDGQTSRLEGQLAASSDAASAERAVLFSKVLQFTVIVGRIIDAQTRGDTVALAAAEASLHRYVAENPVPIP